MKCYRHHDADAIAICKHCAKGTCAACAIDGPGGLACSEECRARIDRVEEMVHAANAASRMNRRGAAYFQPAFLLVAGLAFLSYAIWLAPSGGSTFGVLTGIVFVLFGLGLAAIQFTWQRRAGPVSKD